MNKKITQIILSTLGISIAISVVLNFFFNRGNYFGSLPIFFMYAFTFSLGNHLYFIWVSKVLSWHQHPKRTLIISILGVIPLNALMLFVINFVVSVGIFHHSVHDFFQNEKPLEYVFVIMISLIISMFILMWHFVKVVHNQHLEAERLQTETQKSKWNSLKTQLDPHFLFNSLNVLTALISENPEQAENFSIKLSHIYRYVLDQSNETLVALDKEMQFARNYLQLLQIRFEDGLKYSLPSNLPAQAEIPPLSLQVLLENAIKHNALSQQKVLHIRIEITDDKLIVSNPIQPKKIPEESHKTGLENLKERYRLLGKELSVVHTDSEFLVTLPLF